ncbi:Mitochondrial outer membrane protein iml2 [Diplodia intermedia]|uniref:Inclusion body clearance protein IML2 n=1 Tax=Diplodia intermedia TaxID=856260 RepID=A0ABR3TXD5_9PEZI
MPLGNWLGSKAKLHGSTQSLNALEEPQQLEAAMRAADTLKDAENSASEHLRKAQRHAPRSSIYPAGAEFASCVAQAQLMGAIVGVLNESLTESIKGFYNMRKAFVALDAIIEAEKANLGKSIVTGSPRVSLGSQSVRSVATAKEIEAGVVAPQGAAGSQAPSTTASSSKLAVEDTSGEGSTPLSETDEFFDADEEHEGVPTPPIYAGHLELKGEKIAPPPSYEAATSSAPAAEKIPDITELADDVKSLRLATDHPSTDPSLLGDDATDIFIHSGTNMCFGVLMLVISMIPPAFAMLLKIVGFKGDRDRGLAMLWQATKFDNVYGGLAGLIILSYYNGMLGFCDIVPGPGQEGAHPRERCAGLLVEMRQRYPSSHLWLLEEARMLASARQLEEALTLMSDGGRGAPQLKQVEALHWFERSLDLMYAHRLRECAAAFQKCVSLNNWSHGLYYYIAACAHVELYREAVAADDAAAADRDKKEAERLLKLVPKHTGKKRFMARQLPFDTFVNRKLAKWEARRAELGASASVVDAVGVAPVEEVIYFWNGYKRMRPAHLELSLAALDRIGGGGGGGDAAAEPLDERCIRSLLRATAMRNLGRVQQAKELLLTQVLCVDAAQLRGGNKDNWTLPAACYEMGACLWEEVRAEEREKGEHGLGKEGKERLRECGSWVEKVAKWGEGYDLDAR